MKFKTLPLTALIALSLAACQQSTPNAPKSPSTEQAAPNATSKENLPWAGDQDLVCEMKVDQTAEDTVHYGGKIYGFCGQAGKKIFRRTLQSMLGSDPVPNCSKSFFNKSIS